MCMKSSTNPKICPYCESEDTVRYGIQREKQRYKCKSCNRTFCETNNGVTYERNTKKALALIYNLLSNDFYYKTSIKDAWTALSKQKIKNDKLKVKLISHLDKNPKIECYNAKTIICLENDTIIFHQIQKSMNQEIKIQDYKHYEGQH